MGACVSTAWAPGTDSRSGSLLLARRLEREPLVCCTYVREVEERSGPEGIELSAERRPLAARAGGVPRDTASSLLGCYSEGKATGVPLWRTQFRRGGKKGGEEGGGLSWCPPPPPPLPWGVLP